MYRPDLDGQACDDALFGQGGKPRMEPGDWTWAHNGDFLAILPSGSSFHQQANPLPGTRAATVRWDIGGPKETTTITPSINCVDHEHGDWHGFLTAGEWRTC